MEFKFSLIRYLLKISILVIGIVYFLCFPLENVRFNYVIIYALILGIIVWHSTSEAIYLQITKDFIKVRTLFSHELILKNEIERFELWAIRKPIFTIRNKKGDKAIDFRVGFYFKLSEDRAVELFRAFGYSVIDKS